MIHIFNLLYFSCITGHFQGCIAVFIRAATMSDQYSINRKLMGYYVDYLLILFIIYDSKLMDGFSVCIKQPNSCRMICLTYLPYLLVSCDATWTHHQ